LITKTNLKSQHEEKMKNRNLHGSMVDMKLPGYLNNLSVHQPFMMAIMFI